MNCLEHLSIVTVSRSLIEGTWLKMLRCQCTMYFCRNIFSYLPATKVRQVSHMLKAIHAQEKENRDAADRKALLIIEHGGPPRLTPRPI